MDIKVEGNNIIVNGLVRGNAEVDEIKSVATNLINSHKSIIILLESSYVIPSSLIGYLLKIIHDNKINVSIRVKQKELYELLDRLNLVSALRVSKA